MFRAAVFRPATILLVLLATLGHAHAGGGNIAVLHIASLDEVTADMERLMSLAQVDADGGTLLIPLQQASGLTDLSWIDGSRPLVVVFPVEGMALGLQGLLSAFPAADPHPLLFALTEMYGEPEVTDSGVMTFSRKEEGPLVVAASDGYVVVGANSELVGRFDPEAALDTTGFPPGGMVLEIHLEPVAPLLQMGLVSGRHMLEEKMSQEGSATGEAAPTQPDLDPRAVMPVVDLYLDMIRDLIANTSRLQISADIGPEHLVLHGRVVPMPGSTLAGLLEVQEGGLPDLVKFLEPEAMIGAVAGQITLTAPFVEAVREYALQYVEAMQSLAERSDAMPSGLEMLEPSLKILAESAGMWEACYRGDFAQTFDLEMEGGFSSRQVVGIADRDLCRELMDSSAEMLSTMSISPDGPPMITVSENALVHRGVEAMRLEMEFDIAALSQGSDEMQSMLVSWFGDDRLTSYSGMTNDLMISTTGPGAAEEFRGLVDRVKARKKHLKKMTGLTADHFHPVAVGPGLFGSIDFGRLLGTVLGAAPVEGWDEAQALRFFRNLPEGAGLIVFGGRFEEQALHFEVAMPVGLIEAMGKLESASDDDDEGD